MIGVPSAPVLVRVVVEYRLRLACVTDLIPKELGGTGCTEKHTRFRVCNKQVCCMSVSICNYFNPIPPGGVGGGGGRKCPRRFQLSRTSLIFKQYLLNVATFTKIYWRTRF